MSWYKIELSDKQLADNETGIIQNNFDAIWMAAGNPEGFALFHTTITKRPDEIYVSPVASEICKLLIKKYTDYNRWPKL